VTRIFFVAGETSGDAHGARLIHALRAQDPELQCEGLGGVQMAAAGMELRYDLAGEAIMGFTEVIKHLLPIRRLFLDTEAHVKATRPDAVVLIDYPGFNLRFAKRMHAAGIPVIYYISPQVWAWKKGRLKTIAETVDKMLVIFPFEETFYRDAGVDCAYVGHPLLEHTQGYVPQRSLRGEPLIGLLPGSREQEIQRLLPVMIETARGILDEYPEAEFVTPCVNAKRADQIRALAGDFPLDIAVDGMYDVLAQARFCLVASGTATLETALFDVPMLLLYKVSAGSYWLARRLVDIEHIGIVNILAGRGIVPEFIQGDAQAPLILPKALELIADTPARAAMQSAFSEVRQLLGEQGASERAAQEILSYLQSTHT
jgi:lipid-A-disaccharide synthase